MRYKDITGQVFTDLTAVRYVGPDKKGCARWLFLCICGKEIEYPASLVVKGDNLSCGCRRGRLAAITKVCRHCGEVCTRKNRHGNPASVCYKCYNSQTNHFKIRNPKYQLVVSARARAKKYDLPITITVDDFEIPEFCPIFGIKLEFGSTEDHNASPSLDRIIPQLGYVPGNVAVISHRANQIKSNGSAEQHRKIADWIEANRPIGFEDIPFVVRPKRPARSREPRVRPTREFSEGHREALSIAAQKRQAREKAEKEESKIELVA